MGGGCSAIWSIANVELNLVGKARIHQNVSHSPSLSRNTTKDEGVFVSHNWKVPMILSPKFSHLHNFLVCGSSLRRFYCKLEIHWIIESAGRVLMTSWTWLGLRRPPEGTSGFSTRTGSTFRTPPGGLLRPMETDHSLPEPQNTFQWHPGGPWGLPHAVVTPELSKIHECQTHR